MIAALVTTVVRLALSPSVAARVLELARRARAACRASRGATRRSAISLARPVVARGAEPDQALDVGREAGVERLQAPLGAELEERVGLEPGLLGLAALAGADRGLHAVERERDQVEVGLVGRLLPLGRHESRELVLDRRAERLDLVVGRRRRLRCAASVVTAASAVELALDRGRRAAGSRFASWSLEVGEARPGRRRERDGLLDLEVVGDRAVLDAAAVLDRDQREEAQELLGAACLLLGGERRGGEAVERPAISPRALATAGMSPARRRAQRGERARRPRPRRRAAVLLVARRRGSRSSRRPARRPRRAGGEAPLGARRRRRRAARAGAPGRRRAGPWRRRARAAPRRQLARARAASTRVGGVGARAREARGGAELAQQQPRARGGGVAAAGAVERDRVGAARTSRRGRRRARLPARAASPRARGALGARRARARARGGRRAVGAQRRRAAAA